MNLLKMKWSNDKRADLHIHSHFSDGLNSPLQIAKIMAQKKIQVIALTDHACVAGIVEMIVAGAEFGIYVIPAVELNSRRGDFLGYFIDYRNQDLLSFLKNMDKSRKLRMDKIVAKVRELGYPVDWPPQSLAACSGQSAPSRTHLARLLVETGRFENEDAVFDNLLGRGKPGYVEPDAPGEEDCIKIIKKAGGISVLAHPHFQVENPKDDVESYCSRLKSFGVIGYEDIPKNAGYDQIGEQWHRAGEKNGLLKIKCSNFHGKEILKTKIEDVTIGCDQLHQMVKRLPDNCLYQSYFERIRWRRANLSDSEFRQSLNPKNVMINRLHHKHLLKNRRNYPDLPSDFSGLPFVLIGPSAFQRHDEIKHVLKKFGALIISEIKCNNYPEISWFLYGLNLLERQEQEKELFRFSFDRHIYGESSSRACIIIFENKNRFSLRKIKKEIRIKLGPIKFYRVSLNGHARICFTSFIHIPDEENIAVECWKLKNLFPDIKFSSS